MVRVLLRVSENMVEQPIVSEIILELRVPINIITARVNSKGGEVLAEVAPEVLDEVVKAFRKRGVSVSLPKLIEVDVEKCISCGSCVALCPVDAIAFSEDLSVVFDKEKCVGSTCSACVDACPARAIKSDKQNSSELNGNSH
jgi:Na+-translocating ferredoxin:NAD+ oxidoreductase RNF subunit RnfB